MRRTRICLSRGCGLFLASSEMSARRWVLEKKIDTKGVCLPYF